MKEKEQLLAGRVYYDGLTPGVLYSVGQGPPQVYTQKTCFNGGPCRISCVLYTPEGSCRYSRSLRDQDYRDLDNLILFKEPKHLSVHPSKHNAIPSPLLAAGGQDEKQGAEENHTICIPYPDKPSSASTPHRSSYLERLAERVLSESQEANIVSASIDKKTKIMEVEEK